MLHSLGGFQSTSVSAGYRVAITIQGAGTPTGSATVALYNTLVRESRRAT